jgi:hypothetical protein
MSYLINQATVLTKLHNLMGHRVAPGGTDDDLKGYVQAAFDYAWRYYKWSFAMKTATTAADGVLPTDFDLDGYYSIPDTAEIVWDSALGKLKFSPAAALDFTYQIAPPTLGTDAAGSAPFPSAQVIALGATIYAKQAENPTRADVQQEWDMFHSELDRLAGRADAHKPHRPRNFHDVAGTFTGDVG